MLYHYSCFHGNGISECCMAIFLHSLLDMQTTITSLAFSPNGKHLASGGESLYCETVQWRKLLWQWVGPRIGFHGDLFNWDSLLSMGGFVVVSTFLKWIIQ